jgi:hypothetical protein
MVSFINRGTYITNVLKESAQGRQCEDGSYSDSVRMSWVELAQELVQLWAADNRGLDVHSKHWHKGGNE